MIRFDLENIAFEEGSQDELYRLVLGVCAEITIIVGDRLFLSEPSYPVVELARQIQGQASLAIVAGESFSLTSVELEQPEFVRFEGTHAGNYKIHSPFQRYECGTEISRVEVLNAFQRFVGDVLVGGCSILRRDLRPAVFD
jgi:hypothetical protein